MEGRWRKEHQRRGVPSAYVAAAPHSMAFSPPHDGPASCGAGSQLCFLSQSPFMWSLPRVLPASSLMLTQGAGVCVPHGELRQDSENDLWPGEIAFIDTSVSKRLHKIHNYIVMTVLTAKAISRA